LRLEPKRKAAAFTSSGLTLCANQGQWDEPALQVAHEAEGLQEPHEAPDPAITPLLPTAENSEIIRPVFSLPHLGQAIGASASDMARRASNFVAQSEHLYS
jgi:hypothetical protein